ncbi:MAG: prolipoprotein diacylglyceryl transferase, partial [Elusimicrobia bacterium]|nr:prolipoprotein diacylglyceryl transferase [Elusimicrobiota bacterium]
TYGVLVAGSFLVGWWVAQQNVHRLALEERLFEQVAWWAVIGGLLGGRLTYVALNLSDYLNHPVEIFKIWQGGMVFYGGFLVAAVAGAVCVRRYRRTHGLVHDGPVCVWRFADALAPAIALGHAMGRLGCFAAGCCYGRPTAFRWGVIFRHPESLAPLGIRLHPTQLYEAALNLGIFGLLQWRLLTIVKRETFEQKHPGQVFAWYVGLYAVTRFFLEWWRGDDRGPLVGGVSPSQWAAIGCLVALSLWRWTQGRSCTN